VKLEKFLLDEWLERHEGSIRFDLAASTGPRWTLRQLSQLMTDEEREAVFDTPLSYRPGHGGESLRREIAAMYGARPEEIQVTTGAAEALLVLFFLNAEPGANVVVASPAFPPMVSIPESMGVEVRRYPLDARDGFRIDPGRPGGIESLVDRRTKFVLVNSPHNPTGAVASEEVLGTLEGLTAARGIQLVVDEVYHPIYRSTGAAAPRSAGEYTSATVLGDFSKAFSLSGIRVGWILERDRKRREEYWNARAHFSISSNFPGELLAEVAVRHRETIFDRARAVSETNLRVLQGFFREHEETFGYVPPAGGMTSFPWLRSGANARPLCEAAAAREVLLAPGDAFGCPAHFRLGFAKCSDGFAEALDRIASLPEVQGRKRSSIPSSGRRQESSLPNQR
jgi:aspartate/methionine/tyrosine aminotransferase